MNDRIVFTIEGIETPVRVEIPTGSVPTERVLDGVRNREGVTNARLITTAELPIDRLFRGAWDDSNPEYFIGINLPKAKEIAHGKRRTKRELAFAPHDEIISKQIPGNDANAAEAARQVVRDADALVQGSIDGCVDEAELRMVIETEGL